MPAPAADSAERADAEDHGGSSAEDAALSKSEEDSLHVEIYCAITDAPREAGAVAVVDVVEAAPPGDGGHGGEAGRGPAGMLLSQGGAQVASPPLAANGGRPRPPLRPPGGAAAAKEAEEAQGAAGAAGAAARSPPAAARHLAAAACRPSAAQQARARPQDKAAWAAAGYDFLNGVPDRAGLPEHLHHGNLEAGLTRKVLEAQPKHALPGHHDVVVQDMVSATMREIVGVMESLLDRLLLEKKFDTIRNMVAELMTADVASTIAVGREQLRHREFARIDGELERLTVELRGSAARWEDRFQVTRELREAQDGLGERLDERLAGLEDRLARAERSLVPRAELDARLAVGEREAGELGGRLAAAEERLAQALAGLEDLEARSSSHLATRAALAEAEGRMVQAVVAVQHEAAGKLEALRAEAAPAARLAEVRALSEAAGARGEARAAELRAELEGLGAALQRERQRGDAALEALAAQREALEGLRREAGAWERGLREGLEGLGAGAATRQELERQRLAAADALGALRAAHAGTAAQLQEALAGLRGLEEHCHGALATKEYAHETSKALAYHAARESDGHALVEQLRREFEEEQERSRQTMRQVQVSRRDLSDMIEIFHETRERCSDLGTTCARIAQQVEELDGRESEHWTQAQATVSRQGQAHEQLEVFHRALREEFVSHTDMQRSDAEKLRNHSTQRYLEQMDKALDLHRSLESISMGHKELNETVRSIKLPKVLESSASRGTMC